MTETPRRVPPTSDLTASVRNDTFMMATSADNYIQQLLEQQGSAVPSGDWNISVCIPHTATPGFEDLDVRHEVVFDYSARQDWQVEHVRLRIAALLDIDRDNLTRIILVDQTTNRLLKGAMAAFTTQAVVLFLVHQEPMDALYRVRADSSDGDAADGAAEPVSITLRDDILAVTIEEEEQRLTYDTFSLSENGLLIELCRDGHVLGTITPPRPALVHLWMKRLTQLRFPFHYYFERALGQHVHTRLKLPFNRMHLADIRQSALYCRTAPKSATPLANVDFRSYFQRVQNPLPCWEPTNDRVVELDVEVTLPEVGPRYQLRLSTIHTLGDAARRARLRRCPIYDGLLPEVAHVAYIYPCDPDTGTTAAAADPLSDDLDPIIEHAKFDEHEEDTSPTQQRSPQPTNTQGAGNYNSLFAFGGFAYFDHQCMWIETRAFTTDVDHDMGQRAVSFAGPFQAACDVTHSTPLSAGASVSGASPSTVGSMSSNLSAWDSAIAYTTINSSALLHSSAPREAADDEEEGDQRRESPTLPINHHTHMRSNTNNTRLAIGWSWPSVTSYASIHVAARYMVVQSTMKKGKLRRVMRSVKETMTFAFVEEDHQDRWISKAVRKAKELNGKVLRLVWQMPLIPLPRIPTVDDAETTRLMERAVGILVECGAFHLRPQVDEARLESAMGMLRTASMMLEHAAPSSPELAIIYTNVAELNLREDQSENVGSMLRRALEIIDLCEGKAGGLLRMATSADLPLLQRIGYAKKSLKYSSNVAKSRVLNLLGIHYWKSGRPLEAKESFVLAVEAAQRPVADHPNEPFESAREEHHRKSLRAVLRKIGALYSEMGRQKEARQAVTDMQAEDAIEAALCASALNNIGTFYRANGNRLAARRFFRLALQPVSGVLDSTHTNPRIETDAEAAGNAVSAGLPQFAQSCLSERDCNCVRENLLETENYTNLQTVVSLPTSRNEIRSFPQLRSMGWVRLSAMQLAILVGSSDLVATMLQVDDGQQRHLWLGNAGANVTLALNAARDIHVTPLLPPNRQTRVRSTQALRLSLQLFENRLDCSDSSAWTFTAGNISEDAAETPTLRLGAGREIHFAIADVAFEAPSTRSRNPITYLPTRLSGSVAADVVVYFCYSVVSGDESNTTTFINPGSLFGFVFTHAPTDRVLAVKEAFHYDNVPREFDSVVAKQHLPWFTNTCSFAGPWVMTVEEMRSQSHFVSMSLLDGPAFLSPDETLRVLGTFAPHGCLVTRGTVEQCGGMQDIPASSEAVDTSTLHSLHTTSPQTRRPQNAGQHGDGTALLETPVVFVVRPLPHKWREKWEHVADDPERIDRFSICKTLLLLTTPQHHTGLLHTTPDHFTLMLQLGLASLLREVEQIPIVGKRRGEAVSLPPALSRERIKQLVHAVSLGNESALCLPCYQRPDEGITLREERLSLYAWGALTGTEWMVTECIAISTRIQQIIAGQRREFDPTLESRPRAHGAISLLATFGFQDMLPVFAKYLETPTAATIVIDTRLAGDASSQCGRVLAVSAKRTVRDHLSRIAIKTVGDKRGSQTDGHLDLTCPTALHIAVQRRNCSTAKKLLELGGNPAELFMCESWTRPMTGYDAMLLATDEATQLLRHLRTSTGNESYEVTAQSKHVKEWTDLLTATEKHPGMRQLVKSRTYLGRTNFGSVPNALNTLVAVLSLTVLVFGLSYIALQQQPRDLDVKARGTELITTCFGSKVMSPWLSAANVAALLGLLVSGNDVAGCSNLVETVAFNTRVVPLAALPVDPAAALAMIITAAGNLTSNVLDVYGRVDHSTVEGHRYVLPFELRYNFTCWGRGHSGCSSAPAVEVGIAPTSLERGWGTAMLTISSVLVACVWLRAFLGRPSRRRLGTPTTLEAGGFLLSTLFRLAVACASLAAGIYHHRLVQRIEDTDYGTMADSDMWSLLKRLTNYGVFLGFFPGVEFITMLPFDFPLSLSALIRAILNKTYFALSVVFAILSAIAALHRFQFTSGDFWSQYVLLLGLPFRTLDVIVGNATTDHPGILLFSIFNGYFCQIIFLNMFIAAATVSLSPTQMYEYWAEEIRERRLAVLLKCVKGKKAEIASVLPLKVPIGLNDAVSSSAPTGTSFAYSFASTKRREGSFRNDSRGRASPAVLPRKASSRGPPPSATFVAFNLDNDVTSGDAVPYVVTASSPPVSHPGQQQQQQQQQTQGSTPIPPNTSFPGKRPPHFPASLPMGSFGSSMIRAAPHLPPRSSREPPDTSGSVAQMGTSAIQGDSQMATLLVLDPSMRRRAVLTGLQTPAEPTPQSPAVVEQHNVVQHPLVQFFPGVAARSRHNDQNASAQSPLQWQGIGGSITPMSIRSGHVGITGARSPPAGLQSEPPSFAGVPAGSINTSMVSKNSDDDELIT